MLKKESQNVLASLAGGRIMLLNSWPGTNIEGGLVPNCSGNSITSVPPCFVIEF